MPPAPRERAEWHVIQAPARGPMRATDSECPPKPGRKGIMGRLVLFASSIASVLLLTLIYAVVATQTGGTPSASGSPSSSAAASPGAVLGEIAISAFDLGFDPATV